MSKTVYPTPFADWLKHHATTIQPMRDAPDWEDRSDSEYDDAYNVHLEALHAMIDDADLLDAAPQLLTACKRFIEAHEFYINNDDADLDGLGDARVLADQAVALAEQTE